MVSVTTSFPAVTSGSRIQYTAVNTQYEWCKGLIDTVNPAVATPMQRTQQIQCVDDVPHLNPGHSNAGVGWIFLALFLCTVFACFIPFMDDGSKR
jgi:hypothetical protein